VVVILVAVAPTAATVISLLAGVPAVVVSATVAVAVPIAVAVLVVFARTAI